MPIHYCNHCGASGQIKIPPADDRPRFVCDQCGHIQYENPKVVVGVVPTWNSQVLLCRRAIEPRHGFWTLPAGYLESGETMEQGARRETVEEAGAKLGTLRPFAVFDLPFVSQIYFMFLGEMISAHFQSGTESLETRLFSESEIPWKNIAFTVIDTTLKHYFADRKANRIEFHTGVIVPPRHMSCPPADRG